MDFRIWVSMVPKRRGIMGVEVRPISKSGFRGVSDYKLYSRRIFFQALHGQRLVEGTLKIEKPTVLKVGSAPKIWTLPSVGKD
ncbi:hypothetical protein PanWU01x14_101640 [Parasponia andersonii]|uniref:Uncharacterized protein n=1 Tax=Parasponia andersonii TaxID=3476 RepID=A0A2P5D374_PARAD|nr:hypothetical protein PanWU01x14_101640 [Parasponia andersonii]